MKNFYDPTPEELTVLESRAWSVSWSGGKDSTTAITRMEWLRRAGWITVEKPAAVRTDTMVDEPHLVAVAEELTNVLAACGWEITVVHPEVHERLYPQILGRGLPPIHPGVKNLRWCTRSTKIDPMYRLKLAIATPLSITGLRLGESAMRDGKLLKKSSCAAGGECGIPEPSENTFSPILKWATCQVWDWLRGLVGREVRGLMADVFAVTEKLADAYDLQTVTTLFEEDEVNSLARFGCIGCPAIGAGATAPRAVVRRYGSSSPLLELYDVWYEARRPENRLVYIRKDGAVSMGPLRLETRKRLFDRVMGIQHRAGIVLITPEDEVFIRQCWENKVYPKGWSEEDEYMIEQPLGPLFDNNQDGMESSIG